MTRRIALDGLPILYFALVSVANHRHLWHDELYTYHIARALEFADEFPSHFNDSYWPRKCLHRINRRDTAI
jgi:hypothetical protein